MKYFAYIFATVLLLASCSTNASKGHGIEPTSTVDSIDSDYIANSTAIEQKKQEMLSVADSAGNF